MFKVKTAVGTTKFKSSTVQREATLSLRGGGGQKHTCRRYLPRDTHATGRPEIDLYFSIINPFRIFSQKNSFLWVLMADYQ